MMIMGALPSEWKRCLVSSVVGVIRSLGDALKITDQLPDATSDPTKLTE